MSDRRILVTSALPYANGHIHIGHLVEYLQTDIWVRFQKLMGRRCVYLCADDTHGTAIMMRARQEGRTEESWIADMQAAHVQDFEGFGIEFDHYGSTNSPANNALCIEIWQKLQEKGMVHEREVEQLFDAEAGTFLADRFVKGTCPNPECGAADQYGDRCAVCSHTYSATELIDPVSTLSGGKPELRSSPHMFIEIEQLHGFLEEWTQSGDHLQPEIANYLKGHFLQNPLRDWDVSRPAPYFGFTIPDKPGHSWYVWFDAPIGYMASTKEWCDQHDGDFDDWWRSEETDIHHFIGKDITYFHTLFWPAMLKSAGFTLPKKIHIHGFLTVNGEKMSKRRGTFILASTYLKHLNPSYLRYYYAAKLGTSVDDLDLNAKDFVNKVNSDLVNKVVNLASRSAKFVKKTGLAAEYPDDGGLFEQAAQAGDEIADAYESCDFNKAMRRIMGLTDAANQYVDAAKPWDLAKDPETADQAQRVCTVALNLFRQVAIYLTPVLPTLAKQTGDLLNSPIESWNQSKEPLVGVALQPFKHLMKRVDPKAVAAMIEESKQAASEEETPDVSQDDDAALKKEPLEEQLASFDDFMKLDLRVARVIKAEEVADSRKLLQLTLSLGGEEKRNVL
ncbi:MAG: methionine--tRNA ligase, partial [Planctomycetales bacterium]